MRARTASFTGPLVAGGVLVLLAVGLWMQLNATPEAATSLTIGDRTAPMTLALFAVVAGIVTARRPDLVVGWLLLGFVGLMALTGAATGVAQRPGAAVASTALAAWIQSWAWLPAITLLAIALLHFPDGRLPSPRWRVVLAVDALALGIAAVLAAALWPHRGPELLDPDRPWPGATATIGGIALALVLFAFVTALSSLLLRWRTAATLVRLQLKWLLAAVACLVAALVLSAVLELLGYGDVWLQDLFGISGLLLLPLAIGAAVLRYRLFEIDRIISRTVGWLIVTALLAGGYVAGVLGLGAFAPDRGGDLVVAVSTLGVAALFQPLRRLVQEAVDQRFNRARYDATRAAADFGRALRDEVRAEAVVASLSDVVRRTLAPSAVQVLGVATAKSPLDAEAGARR